MPKVRGGTNPWHRQGQPGGPNQAASSQVLMSSGAWSRKEPLAGRHGTCGVGLVDAREPDVERGSAPRALASPGKLLFPPFWEKEAGGNNSPDPQHGTLPPPTPAPGTVSCTSCLLGSCFWEGRLHTWWGFSSHSPQSCGGGQQKGDRLRGRPGSGAWREERKGKPSTCSVQCQQPDQGWPPPGSPRPGPQQPSGPDMDVHTHTHAQQPHTHTHPPHTQT